MSGLRLTIADSNWDSKKLLFQNLKTLIYGLMLPLAVTIVSGFWYMLVSHEINWNASQTILVLHLVAGVISAIIAIPFVLLHQKEKKQKLYWMLMPWKLARQSDETRHHFYQRMLGLLLLLNVAVVFISGFLIALPGVLFYFKVIILFENSTAAFLMLLHRLSAILMLVLLFVHMLWLQRNRQLAQQVADTGKEQQ